MNLCLAMGLVTQKSRSPSRLPDQAPPMEQSKVKSPDEFLIKEISPGALELGSVRLNQAQRSIAFSAKVQHARRPYQIPFSDISHGKVNESVFKMDALPVHIHVCAILLGAKGADYEFLKKRFSQLKENEIVAPDELEQMVRQDLFGLSTEMNIS